VADQRKAARREAGVAADGHGAQLSISMAADERHRRKPVAYQRWQ